MKKLFTMLRRAADWVWNASFGPCCDNPKLTFNEGPGFTVSTCSNCKKTKTFTRAGF